MKMRVTRPLRLVDVSRLPGLDRIEWRQDGGVRVGALVRNSTLAHDGRFATAFPAVAEALLSGASAQLRNAATVAGNLLQRTRCPYFWDGDARCNKREPGTGCDAREGESRGHAVLGWSSACIATHPSDFCVPFSALDAVVEVEGPGGRRDITFDTLHRLPGESPEHDTVLAPGELITAVRLPPDAAGFAAHARYVKLRERTSYAFAVVSAAGMLRLERGVVAEARIALGGVAAKPWRAMKAERLLVGQVAGADAFREAAAAALEGATPSGDNGHKIELARRVVVRVLQRAAAGTPGRLPALPASPFAIATEAPLHA